MGRSKKVPNSEGHWQCSKCGLWKSEADFYKRHRSPNGLQSACIQCMSGVTDSPDEWQERLRRKAALNWRREVHIWNLYVDQMVRFGLGYEASKLKAPWEYEDFQVPWEEPEDGLIPHDPR